MAKIIYTLLIVVFMIHEFEEIIVLKFWLIKEKDYLQKNFPKIGTKIYSQYSTFSTAGLALAIAEEFILISLLIYLAILIPNMYIWFAVLMGLLIHFFVHIISWIIYKKFVPAAITSVLAIPYCIYGLIVYFNNETYKIEMLIIYTIIVIIFFLINLRFMHYLGKRFSVWEKKYGEK